MRRACVDFVFYEIIVFFVPHPLRFFVRRTRGFVSGNGNIIHVFIIRVIGIDDKRVLTRLPTLLYDYVDKAHYNKTRLFMHVDNPIYIFITEINSFFSLCLIF